MADDDLAAMDAAIDKAVREADIDGGPLPMSRAIYRAGMVAGMRRAAEIAALWVTVNGCAVEIRVAADALEWKK